MKKLLFLVFIVGLVWLLWGAISIDETKPKEKLQMLEEKGKSLLHKGEQDISTEK